MFHTFHSVRMARPLVIAALLMLLGEPSVLAQIIPPANPQGANPQTEPPEEIDIYLVTFQPDTPAPERAAVVQASGAVLRRTFTVTNAVSVQVPEPAALARLRNDPRVLSVVPSRPITVDASPAQGNGRGNGRLPQAPNSLSATAVSSSAILLTWADTSNNEDGFRVERCADSGCNNFSQVAQVDANVTSYNDTELTADKLYRYRVLAFNGAGNSDYSNIAEATTSPIPIPSPVSVSPDAGSGTAQTFTYLYSDAAGYQNISNAYAQLNATQTWFGSCGVMYRPGFLFLINDGASAWLGPLAVGQPGTLQNSQCTLDVGASSANGSGTELTLNLALSFQPSFIGTKNHYLRAQDGMHNLDSGWQLLGTWNPDAPPSPPAAPSSLATSTMSDSQINLSWSDNSGNEDGFGVERCVGVIATCSETDFMEIAQLGPNSTSYSDNGLQEQTTYSHRIRAFNASGSSAYSNTAEATTSEAPSSTQIVPGGVQRIGAAPGALNWTGAGVGVAVVDTGLDFGHPDLALSPEEIGANSFNAFGGSCQDIFGHGTHVAGIIAARDNTEDVVGVAPGATLYCVNVFQEDPIYGVVATDESLIAGLEWVATNANTVTPRIRVVNMSLGRSRTADDTPDHPLHLAVKALYDMGLSVVVSAGNDPLVEVSEEIPASYPEVMAVASTTAVDGVNGYDEFFPPCVGEQGIKRDTASYFTTDGAFLGGTGVTVSAPGEEREDIFFFEGGCYLEPIGILSTAMGGGTIELYGTSMAAPHVTGVVALMWQKELSLGFNLAPEDARTRIRNNVDRLGTVPLDAPIVEYTFDGEREGVIWAPAALWEEPPPLQDFPPTVMILNPANGSSFAEGASILFEGAANDPEQGDLAGSLVWTSSRDGQIGTGASFLATLSNGNHTITASATDAGGNFAKSSISITVGSPSGATSVQIGSVTYALQGENLISTVSVVNEFGAPVPDATVSGFLMEWLYTGQVWPINGTTNSQGDAKFTLINAPIGCYLTEVQNLVADGLTWVGGTPSNYACK